MTRPRAPTALLLLAALTGAALGQARPPAHPRRAPLARSAAPHAQPAGSAAPAGAAPPPAVTSARACAACHPAIVREWESSLHRHSWDDPFFQRAYALEPRAFCARCHDVEARAALGEGISCAVCHVRDAHILGTGADRTDGPPSAAPHAERTDPALGTSAFCAPCHQFDFPRDGVRAGLARAPLQNTLREWERSPAHAAGAQCQQCHMPWVDEASGRRHRSHAFPGITPAMLARAVDVRARARREGDAIVLDVAITPRAAGHAFPTGDLFRRLELSAWVPDSAAPPALRVFERRWRFRAGGGGAGVLAARIPAGDTRVQFATERVRLRFTARAGAEVRWRLEHLRMPPVQMAVQSYSRAEVSTLVAQGALTP